MKKFKKIISMGLASAMALSIMCVSVSATENEAIAAVDTEQIIEVTGQPGDVVDIGGGFKFVITDAPDNKYNVQQSRASSRLWNITDLAPSNIYTGGGYYIDLAFVLNSSYRYVHIDLNNEQPADQRTRLRIYAGEDATDPVTSWITVVGGGYGYVFNDQPMTGTYFIRYSSNTAIDGSSYAYRGNSLSDVMY